MPGRIKYALAPEICRALSIIVESLGLDYIDTSRIYCVRSRGSRARAYARIYGMPQPWVAVLGAPPGYVIEVLSEKFDPLPPREKVKVLIHELLHIPSTFSGGLRPHGRLVNGRAVYRLFRRLESVPGAIDRIYGVLES